MNRSGKERKSLIDEEANDEEERKLIEDAGIDYRLVQDWSAEERKSTLQALKESASFALRGNQDIQSESENDDQADSDDNQSTQAPDDRDESEEFDMAAETIAPSPLALSTTSEEDTVSHLRDEQTKKVDKQEAMDQEESEGETQAYDLQTHSKRHSKLLDAETVRQRLDSDSERTDCEKDKDDDDDQSIPGMDVKKKTGTQKPPRTEKFGAEEDGESVKKLPRKYKSMGFLYPPFYAPESVDSPKLFVPVIKLMFDICIRRLIRGQQQMKGPKMDWGDPVTAGFHREGCLKMKSPPKTSKTELPVHKGRSLRSHGLVNVDNGMEEEKDKNESHLSDVEREKNIFTYSGRHIPTRNRLQARKEKVFPTEDKSVVDVSDEDLRISDYSEESLEIENDKKKKEGQQKQPVGGRKRAAQNIVYSESSSEDSDNQADKDNDWVPQETKPMRGRKVTASSSSIKANTTCGRRKKVEGTPVCVSHSIKSAFNRMSVKKRKDTNEKLDTRDVSVREKKSPEMSAAQETVNVPKSVEKKKASVYDLNSQSEADNSDDDFFKDNLNWKNKKLLSESVSGSVQSDKFGIGLYSHSVKLSKVGKEDHCLVESVLPKKGLRRGKGMAEATDYNVKKRRLSNHSDNEDGRQKCEEETPKKKKTSTVLSQDNNSTDSVISLLNVEGEMYSTQIGQRKKTSKSASVRKLAKKSESSNTTDSNRTKSPLLEENFHSVRALVERSGSERTNDSIDSKPHSPLTLGHDTDLQLSLTPIPKKATPGKAKGLLTGSRKMNFDFDVIEETPPETDEAVCTERRGLKTFSQSSSDKSNDSDKQNVFSLEKRGINVPSSSNHLDMIQGNKSSSKKSKSDSKSKRRLVEQSGESKSQAKRGKKRKSSKNPSQVDIEDDNPEEATAITRESSPEAEEPGHQETQDMGYCPLCGDKFPLAELERHAATCGEDVPEPPKETKCMHCSKMIPSPQLRNHQMSCTNQGLTRTTRQSRSGRGQDMSWS